jgi:hypothetical protein
MRTLVARTLLAGRVALAPVAVVGAAASLSAPAQVHAAAPAAAPSPPAPAAAPATPDVAAEVSEIRSAVHQITELRKAAQQSGDKIKETCLYDRLRSLSQTLESAQTAQVAYEGAQRRGDKAQARSEQARADKALELMHKLRSDAENCIGNELRSGPRATTVTVTSSGASDDPAAGPAEMGTIRPVRLEIPSRPNPASAFHPVR